MTEEQPPPSAGAGWPRLAVVGILALAVGVSAGLVAGTRLAADETGVPAQNSVDVGFARDMQAHHAQAVEMSTMVRERTDDPEIRSVALDIALTQQQQIGQMYAWLDTWGYSQSSAEDPMTWMSHPPSDGAGEQENSDQGHGSSHGSEHPGGPGGSKDSEQAAMPGMATPEQLGRLGDSSGRQAELLFLRLMIDHHVGGVEMAEAAADRAEQPQVRDLARAMVNAQQAEIGTMRRMMAARADPADERSNDRTEPSRDQRQGGGSVP